MERYLWIFNTCSNRKFEREIKIKKLVDKVKHLMFLKINKSARQVHLQNLISTLHEENTQIHEDSVMKLFEDTKASIMSLEIQDAFKIMYNFDQRITEANHELSRKNLQYIFDNRHEIALLEDTDRDWFLKLIYEERKKSINKIEAMYQNMNESFSELVNDKEMELKSFIVEEDEEDEPVKKKKKKYQ